MLADTVALSGSILFIIGAASAAAWSLTQSGFSNDLAAFMSDAPGGRQTFLFLSLLLFVGLGSVLEGIPAMVLLAPLLFPIARNLGVNDVHYAMVVILAMGLGLFMPPFGVGYYTACVIGKADPSEAMKSIGPYLLALLVGIIVVIEFPALSTSFIR